MLVVTVVLTGFSIAAVIAALFTGHLMWVVAAGAFYVVAVVLRNVVVHRRHGRWVSEHDDDTSPDG